MITNITPIEHFKDLVKGAIQHQKVKTNELVEYYLSTLLEGFVLSENLNTEPLAIAYMKALGEGSARKIHLMKQLGDISLFTSGFFSDSFKRKIIDIDYYILMGAASYRHLASLHNEGADATVPSLFSELSAKFKLFADVLTEVSERSRLTSSRDILRLYEKWLRTNSPHAESLLRGLGIEPLKISTAPIQ